MRNKVFFIFFIFILYSHFKRFKEPDIFYVRFLPFGFNGMIIPPFGIFILLKHKGNVNLLNHELIHWKQYKRMSLFVFYFTYLFEMLKYGYDLAPMEIEARYVESDFCKLNYSDCVRSGVAKTVSSDVFLQ